MRIDTSAAAPVGPSPQRLDAATVAVKTFRDTGRLDTELLRAGPPSDVARAMSSLPPAERGALEGALGEAGLGGLVKGVLGAATDVADFATDPLIETPSEQNAEVMQGDVQARWLSDLRGQAELDAALSPFAKLDRPVGALASAASVRAITDLDS
jgi:hypothetical protein